MVDNEEIVTPEIIEGKVTEMIEGNFLSRNHSKLIIAGILGATILIGGGVAYANTKQTPAPVATTQVPVVKPIAATTTPTIGKLTLANGEYEGEIKDGMASGQGTLVYRNGDVFKGSFLLNKEYGEGLVTQVIDGKTVIQIRDDPPSDKVAATPTVPLPPLTTPAPKNLPTPATPTPTVTPKATAKATTTTATATTPTVTPKATTAATTAATPTPVKIVSPDPKLLFEPTEVPQAGTTVGRLTLQYQGDIKHPNLPGSYYGEILGGKAHGQGVVYYRIPDGTSTGLLLWKGTFYENAPFGKGTWTYTDKDGKVDSRSTDVEGVN